MPSPTPGAGSTRPGAAPSDRGGVVRAAGGIVLRDRDGETEIVLVHRPKYDDWTLPKGKAHRGESDEDCALREVEEETGLRCELEGDPVDVSYHDSLGRPKVVHYWRMRPDGDTLRPRGDRRGALVPAYGRRGAPHLPARPRGPARTDRRDGLARRGRPTRARAARAPVPRAARRGRPRAARRGAPAPRRRSPPRPGARAPARGRFRNAPRSRRPGRGPAGRSPPEARPGRASGRRSSAARGPCRRPRTPPTAAAGSGA